MIKIGLHFFSPAVICSVEPLFSNNTGTTGNQVMPMNSVNVPTSMSNGDASNLPPPPPLIPISEVLQVIVR